MKVKYAIDSLKDFDPEAELVWHNYGGNNCPITFFVANRKDNEVLVSACSKDGAEEMSKYLLELTYNS